MHSIEGKALCALLQFYEVGLSCNLREKSQHMTCVHAKAASRGITRRGGASSSSLWDPRKAKLILSTTPSPRPGVFPGGWARWVGSQRDRQCFTVQRMTRCLRNVQLTQQAQGFFFLEWKRDFIFQGLVLLASRLQLL